jgi:GT2 family glycosyltransferase
MNRNLAEGRFGFPILFASQANAGAACARNHGVTLARGRYVIFIGDDTVPEARFVAEHARIHGESGDDPLLACLGYTGWPPTERVTAFMEYVNEYGLQFGYKLIEHDAVVPFNFFYTSNISLDRQLLANNPFDTAFSAVGWEDTELAFRLEAIGLKIRYNALAVTRHYHPTTIDSFSSRQYAVGKSAAIFYEKHPGLGDFLGVAELDEKGTKSDEWLRRVHRLALAGERAPTHAQPDVFQRLMRQHYLRGLRDGLLAAQSRKNRTDQRAPRTDFVNAVGVVDRPG